mmetsp:Transcript_88606/g.251171  ORF Transcript_88606/g.251171 Transcript_88606/m.251171 type:complete len:238 (+) Transcript_88606:72-785(+)
MGVVPLIFLAWGAVVKPCISVTVPDHGLDIALAQSKICDAHRHGGWMNMTRQSADTEGPFDQFKSIAQILCFNPFAGFGGFGGSMPSPEDEALKTADKDTGKLAVIKDSVQACCKSHSGALAQVMCTAQLGEYGSIAAEYALSVAKYFQEYAMDVKGMKDAICKIIDVQKATKPIRDVADAVVKLNDKMSESCIALPPEATELMNSMTEGLSKMPKVIALGIETATEALRKMICTRG